MVIGEVTEPIGAARQCPDVSFRERIDGGPRHPGEREKFVAVSGLAVADPEHFIEAAPQDAREYHVAHQFDARLGNDENAGDRHTRTGSGQGTRNSPANPASRARRFRSSAQFHEKSTSVCALSSPAGPVMGTR